MKKILILLALIISLGTTSCLKDKSNTEFTEIKLVDSLFITSQSGFRTDLVIYATSFSLAYGDKLQISPEVHYSGDYELSYKWIIDGVVVSNEKDLDWEMNLTKGAQLIFVVTREGTGNSEFFDMSIGLRLPFETGIAILAEKDGALKLHWIENESYTGIVTWPSDPDRTSNVQLARSNAHEDVYSEHNNGDALPLDITDVSYYRTTISPYTKSLELISSNPENYYSLTMGSIFAYDTKLTEEFIGDVPASIKPVGVSQSGGMSVLLSEDGRVYTRVNYDNFAPHTGRYSPIPVQFNNEDLLVDRIFRPNAGGNHEIIFFTKDKQLLIFQGNYSQYSHSIHKGGYIFAFDETNLPMPAGKTYTDITKPITDKELVNVIMSNPSNGTTIHNLFRDADGNYSIQKVSFQIGSNTGMVTRMSYLSEMDLPNLTNLTKGKSNFKMAYINNSYTSTLSFISVDNIVYLYDFSSDTAKPFAKMDSNIVNLEWGGIYNTSTHELFLYYSGTTISMSLENGDIVGIKTTADMSNVDLSLIDPTQTPNAYYKEEYRIKDAGNVIKMRRIIK